MDQDITTRITSSPPFSVNFVHFAKIKSALEEIGVVITPRESSRRTSMLEFEEKKMFVICLDYLHFYRFQLLGLVISFPDCNIF